MGNRNRTIELSTVPVRAHCPSGEGRHNAIWLRVYDPIFVVSVRTWPLYEKVNEPNTLSCFVVGRAGSEYGLPVAVIPHVLIAVLLDHTMWWQIRELMTDE